MDYLDFTTQALQELFNGEWATCGGIDDISWKDGHSTTAAEYAQISARVNELQNSYDAQDYARKRAAEYPPMSDYLDGVVKGDQAQIDAYIAACLAVKAKYPKPTE